MVLFAFHSFHSDSLHVNWRAKGEMINPNQLNQISVSHSFSLTFENEIREMTNIAE